MSFNGIQIALSSLQAQRRAMEVVGQNVANVATDGYSRQRVDMQSNAGAVTPARYSKGTGIGSGVLSGDVTRIRDAFLEARGHQEHAADAGLRELQGALERVELALGEPGDDGFGAQLADFLAGWHDVANRPDDAAARSQLLQRGQTLANGVADVDTRLGSIRDNAVEQLGTATFDVNATARRVAELNHRIQFAVHAGLAPNDLLDQRGIAVNSLAAAVGATVHDGEDGTVDVYVGSTAIVRGSRAEALEVATAPDGTVAIRWAKDQQPASARGSFGGLVSTVNDVVPRYQALLGDVVDRLRTEVNTAHAAGHGLDGQTGNPFFTTSGPLAVSAGIVADVRSIGASSVAGATRNGNVARTIAALTGADSTYRELVVQVGVESQSAIRRVETQQAITSQIDAAREAVAGVDIDEEMTQMVTFQHAYDAAARLMSTMDQMLDTLINRTGAGR